MKKLKFRYLTAILVFLLTPAFAVALTPAEIDDILEVREVTYGAAARFVLAAAPGGVPAEEQEAFAQAQTRGWLSERVVYSDPASLGGLSLLMMQAFNLPADSFMFPLTLNVRYAFREMRDKGLIAGRAHPSLRLTGEDFLQMLGNVIAYEGGQGEN